jgi:hypothetical protein
MPIIRDVLIFWNVLLINENISIFGDISIFMAFPPLTGIVSRSEFSIIIGT